MDRGPVYLICLVCSCYLISKGDSAVLYQFCTDVANCTIDNSTCSSSFCACDASSNFVVSSNNASCEIETGLGGSCTVNAACAYTPNIVCNGSTQGSTCICETGYVTPSGGSSCKADLGTTCSSNPDCADENALCTSNTCACDPNYFASGPEGSRACLPKKTLGQTCSSLEPCLDSNASCTGTCTCIDTYYDNNGINTAAGSCEPKKTLGQTCSSLEPCLDSKAECTAGTCTCIDTYYDNNGINTADGSCEPKKTLGQTCSSLEPCLDSNASCTGKCTCIDTHYDNNGVNTAEGTCVPKKTLGQTCSSLMPCLDSKAECTAGTCSCIDTYYDNNGINTADGSCEPKKTLGQTCSSLEPCLDSNASCTGKCTCIDTHYDNNGVNTAEGTCVPKKTLGQTCSSLEPCLDSKAECTAGTCTCIDTYYDNNGINTADGSCEPKKTLGQTCSSLEPCLDSNASCTGKCTCIDTHYDNNGVNTAEGTCVPKKGLGQTCLTNLADTEPCLDSNASCTGTCTCIDTHYDNNGINTADGTCVPKKALGQTCLTNLADTEPCLDSNASCTGTCTCINTHYDNNGVNAANGTCVPKKTLGQTCSSLEPCLDSNAECTSGKCTCINTHYDNNGINTADGTCKPKKTLGQTCSSLELCLDSNAECTGKCTCIDTHYDNNGVNTAEGTCEPKKTLGQTCSSLELCLDSNAECTGKCTCFNTHYDNNGINTADGTCVPKKALGQTCTSLANTEPCLDSNARCTGTCTCIDTHYDNNGVNTAEGTCAPKKTLGQTCTSLADTETCLDSNARCTGTCTCNNTHYDNNGVNTAEGTCVPKIPLGQPCTSFTNTEPCSDANARCSAGKCSCKDTFYDNNGINTAEGTCVPKKTLGETCPTSLANTEPCLDSNARCTGGTCSCLDTHYDNNGISTDGTCVPKIPLNQTCTHSSSVTDQCSDFNAECKYNSGYACFCKQDYSESGGKCYSNKPLGSTCGTGVGGCLIANAECIDNLCICNTATYDDNGLLEGGNCRPMTDLLVSGLITDNPQTNGFSVKWTAPDKSEHVSGYTVQWRQKNNNLGGDSFYVGNATSYVVTSQVTAGKAYSVKVISRNEVTQESSTRTVDSVTVEQAAKPNIPGNLDRGSINLDAGNKDIGLQWTPPAGYVSGYTVKLFENTEELASQPFPSAGGIFYYAAMLNGHRYNISITAQSESFMDGTGFSNHVSSEARIEAIKTLVKEPEPPTNVECVERSEFDDKIELRWLPPSLPNGDIEQYHITVKRRDQTTYSRTVSSTTTKAVGGLQPGSYYTFEVITENEMYNSSATSSGVCITKARTSDAPREFTLTDVTSRSIEFEWSYPANTYSEELLGYVVQVRDASHNCAVEMIYQCSDCFKTFTVSTLPNLCNEDSPTTSISSSELKEMQVYNASGLLPDIQYTVYVTAINLAGRGENATVIQTTNEEAPAVPTIDQISDQTSTSFIVMWLIGDTRPGATNYTITVSAVSPAESKTKTVSGFETNTATIEGLEENWLYDVSITASTSAGSRTSNPSSVETDPSAPGQVSAFYVDMRQGGNNNEWKVTWKIPDILERNSNITGYKFKHNATSTTLGKDIIAQDMDYTYEETVTVKPEVYYYVEVFAINEQGQAGVSSKHIKEALAKVPVVIPDPEFPVIPQDSIQTSQKSIKISVNRTFVNLDSGGTVRHTGIICFNHDKSDKFEELLEATMANKYASMTVETFNGMEGWFYASKNGFSPYRVTKPNWIQEFDAKSSGRKKRATDQEIPFIIGGETCNDASQTYCNGQLQENTPYVVVVVVCTNGGCLVSPTSGPYMTLPVPDDPQPIGMIVGVVVAAVVVLAIVFLVIFFMMRRRRNNAPTRMKGSTDIEATTLEQSTKHIQRKRPKKLSEFSEHLELMHKDSNLMFSSEYEDIKTISPKHSQDAANKEDNKLKNRYINILPFDHSLVKLTSNGEDDCQDYINANYLPGYKSKREYIGCQGPIPGTIDDHWRMVWEQNVSVIVMLTLCKEGQKVKCEPYWPTEIGDPKQYGDIVVEVTSYSNIKTYDYRIFTMKMGNKTMHVKHFHFLTWMDFSANVQTGTLIDFITQVRNHVQPPDTAGPIIVHCSAGVGRTGTYCVLDHLMQFLEVNDIEDSSVDIFDMVLNLRENRPHMVQTEQQYIYIHDCLNEIIERKKASENIYQNAGFEGDDENLYQNQQEISLYENVKLGEPRTNL